MNRGGADAPREWVLRGRPEWMRVSRTFQVPAQVPAEMETMRPRLVPLLQFAATSCLLTFSVARANDHDNRFTNSPPLTWQNNKLGGNSHSVEGSRVLYGHETTEGGGQYPTTNQAETDDNFRGLGEPRQAAWVFGPATGEDRPFKVTLDGFAARKTSDGYILSVPGQATPRNPGGPDLPVVSVLIRGIPGATARVELDSAKWTEIKDVTVAPVESRVMEDVTTNAPSYLQVRTPAATVYDKDRFWPERIARLDEAWMGTNRIIRIEVTPFQYNPVRGILRYCPTLEGRIVLEPEKGAAAR
jgi:hypothetical protein